LRKILFVCLGNICRSPAADGVMLHELKRLGLEANYLIDSCGTSAHHVGEPADKRMRSHAMKRGIELPSISRAFNSSEDFEKFDLILAMDKKNFRDLKSMDSSGLNSAKIKLFCDYCSNRNETEVPDPYYGGAKGFEDVLDIVEDGIKGIIKSYEK